VREDKLDLVETLPTALDVLDRICPTSATVAKTVDKYDSGCMPTCGR
jgi:hypothetical protein